MLAQASSNTKPTIVSSTVIGLAKVRCCTNKPRLPSRRSIRGKILIRPHRHSCPHHSAELAIQRSLCRYIRNARIHPAHHIDPPLVVINQQRARVPMRRNQRLHTHRNKNIRRLLRALGPRKSPGIHANHGERNLIQLDDLSYREGELPTSAPIIPD